MTAAQGQDSLAAGNLVAVIAHLYGCKVIDAATVYSLLEHLQHRWTSPARGAYILKRAFMIASCCSSENHIMTSMMGLQLACRLSKTTGLGPIAHVSAL